MQKHTHFPMSALNMCNFNKKLDSLIRTQEPLMSVMTDDKDVFNFKFI